MRLFLDTSITIICNLHTNSEFKVHAVKQARNYFIHFQHVVEPINLLIEAGSADLTAVIEKVNTEELAFAARIAPSTNARLLRNASFDPPSAEGQWN